MRDKIRCRLGLHKWGREKQVVETGEVFLAVRCEICGKQKRVA